MKKSFKIPFIVLSILALVAFLGAAALTVTQVFLVGNEFFGGGAALFNSYFTKYILDAFACGLVNKSVQLAGSIALYVSIVIGLVLAILSLVLIKKKLAPKLICFFGSLLICVLGVLIFPFFVDAAVAGNYVFFFVGGGLSNLILTYSSLGLAALFIILMVVLFVMSVVYAKREVKVAEGLVESEEAPVEEAPAEAPVEAAEAPSDPIEYEDLAAEPVPVFTPEPEPEPEPVQQEAIDPKDLAAMIRDIVRDEIARNNAQQKPEPCPTNDNHSIVGATFGGPLIVQYFGSGVAPVEQKAAAPAPAPEVKPEPEPEPVVEPAPAPVVVEPAPVVEEPVAPKAPIVRIPFEERMIKAEKEMQENYNLVKNEILSWGVKSRVSSSGDTFRLHRKTYVKLTIAGKSLKLYFALNPDDYKDSTIPVQDASDKAAYAEIPLIFKVKSGLSVKRCHDLIQAVMEADGLEQGEVGSVNWVKEIKADMKDKAKKEKEEKDED